MRVTRSMSDASKPSEERDISDLLLASAKIAVKILDALGDAHPAFPVYNFMLLSYGTLDANEYCVTDRRSHSSCRKLLHR